MAGKGLGKKQFNNMATDFGSSPRRIRRRISRYLPADVTPVMGQKTSKMCNYFLPRP
jgi:hypothetical protein